MDRVHQVAIRFTDEELTKLRALSAVTGGNASEVIRLLVRNASIVVKPMEVIESKPIEVTA